jgi:hypothetical protein
MEPLEVSSSEKAGPVEADLRPGTGQQGVSVYTEMMMNSVHRRNSAD